MVAALHHDLPGEERTGGVRWAGTANLTFSDAPTAVRRWVWADEVFPQAQADGPIAELPSSVRELLPAGLAPVP